MESTISPVGCGKCPRQKKDIPSYFLDRSASDFSQKNKLIGENPFVHVIGCSQWLTNCASNSLLSNRVEKTIYNGIDLNVFHPTQSDKKRELHLDDKFVILGMANKWFSEDNIETFEYIVSNLDKSIVLLLVGCSESQMQQNTRDNVLMKGFVKSRTELAEYIWVLIASLFHSSALVCLSIPILSKIRISTIAIRIAPIPLMICFIFRNSIAGMLVGLMSERGYGIDLSASGYTMMLVIFILYLIVALFVEEYAYFDKKRSICKYSKKENVKLFL